jgi:hypothetical protein
LPVRAPNSERRAWLLAWAVALALHAAVILGLGGALPVRAAAPPQAPETVQVMLREPDLDLRKPNLPTLYTELPKNRADKAPKSADFLGNVTSRARDVVPGGDAPLPRLHGEAEDPMVKLERKEPAATPPQAAATAGSPEVDQDGARAAEPGQRAARIPAGSSDVPQPEMDNPGGNASLSGDVSLNTTAWDYAPWLERYRSRLMGLWFAPPAYSMGILKEGGWAEIEVEISRSGQLLRLDLLGQQGHPSLIRAAESAVRAAAPTEALPPDFPESTLILRIRMFDPQVRPR